MKRRMGPRREDGLSLLEVVIAAALLVVVGLMLLMVVTVGSQQLSRAKALTRATSLAQSKMEEVLQKAPGQVPPCATPCPFPTVPEYTYTVAYSPFAGMTALQTAVVTVTGPLSTRVAFAQGLPAGGVTPIATTRFTANVAPDTTILVSAVVDKSTNTLYVRTNEAETAYLHILLGSSRVVSGLALVGYFPATGIDNALPVYQITVTFLDRSTTPPGVCTIGLNKAGASGCAGGGANPVWTVNGGPWVPCGATVNLSSMTCVPISTYFP